MLPLQFSLPRQSEGWRRSVVPLLMSDLGVQYENGLYLSRVSGGAYEGSVYLG